MTASPGVTVTIADDAGVATIVCWTCFTTAMFGVPEETGAALRYASQHSEPHATPCQVCGDDTPPATPTGQAPAEAVPDLLCQDCSRAGVR